MTTNKRQFARCSIFQPSTSAQLTVDGKRWPCEMAQLSIGGSAVITSKKLPEPRTGLGFLVVDGVESVVRITHQESHEKGCLVGLEIVEEVPKQPNSPLTTLAWFSFFGTAAAAAWYAILNLQSNGL